MKNNRKFVYTLTLSFVLVSGLVFANLEGNNEPKRTPRPQTAEEKKASLEIKKRWEASPDGINYKEWETSAAGKKVHASNDKISKQLKAFSNMEAVVTSTTFQRENANTSGPKWLIVKINGEEYMMQFAPKEFEKLSTLKVNDKITVRSRSAGYSPNHPYLILSGDYIEHNKTVLFKRDLSKNGKC